MEEALAALAGITAFALGVAQNATWDAAKHLVSRLLGSGRLDLQGLLIDAFCKAIDDHNRDYDDVARAALLNLKAHVRIDPSLLTDALGVFSYDAFGQLVSDLQSGAYQDQLARQIHHRYLHIDAGQTHSLTVELIRDTLTYYRWTVVSQVAGDQALRLLLLQTAGLEAAERSIAAIQADIRVLQSNVATYQQAEALGAQLEQLTSYLRSLSATQQESLAARHEETERKLFAQRVERLLISSGYAVEMTSSEAIELIARKRGPFGLVIAVSIESRKRLVERQQVATLYKQLSRVGANIGILIAEEGFTPEAHEYAHAQETGNVVRLLTYLEFVRGAVDFHPYLDRMVQNWEQGEISRRGTYLHPIGEDDQKRVYRPLEDHLATLQEGGDRKRIALLGDYGTGKTTLCRHLMWRLARCCEERPEGTRIPIFIDLREFDSVRDIKQLVVYSLQRDGVPDISVLLLDELLRQGEFLFICDGFDEMSYGATRVIIQQNLRMLETLLEFGPNALIVTCRTHFFRNSIDEPNRLRYVHIHLATWGEEEVKAYLQHALGERWQAAFDKISTTYNLRELAATPLFLDMIVHSLEQLQEIQDASHLYEAYTKRWIELQDYRSMMDAEQKEILMQTLAWNMFLTGKHSVHWSQLGLLIYGTQESQIKEDVRSLEYDVRTCSFLVRDREGNYQFSHKSFMEFFIAKKLANEIVQGIGDNFETTQTSYEVDQFIKGILRQQPTGVSQLVDWMKHSNSAILRANSAGVLAKLGNAALNSDVILALETDAQVREVWLPPLLRRVLQEDELIGIGRTLLSAGEALAEDAGSTAKAYWEIASRFATQLFNYSDLASRWFSAKALGDLRLRTDETLRVLLQASSTDPEPGIRSTCAKSLGRVGDAALIAKLQSIAANEIDKQTQKDFEQAVAEIKSRASRQSSPADSG